MSEKPPINDGGSVFPEQVEVRKVCVHTGQLEGVYLDQHRGMTLLDYFAGQAMQAMVSQMGYHGMTYPYFDEVADKAYLIGRAMIAAREAGGDARPTGAGAAGLGGGA